jgi:ABC-type nitrate/sulfonate/bicarbonate transport system substrate-binding protein
LSFVRYVPIIIAVILAGGLFATAYSTVPASQTVAGPSITLRVGYPDSLDESDVTDMYAYTHILPAEGINVLPTFYDAPPLSYKGLISGQQDISFGTTAQSIARGPGLNPASSQTTCVTSYALSGVFLEIAGDGITSPQQMLGKTAEDFGPGTSTRSLNDYWYSQAGVPISTAGVNSSAVYLKQGGGNPARVHDIEGGVVQAIAVDDFILADFQSPSVNNTANHGPFHVLFHAPNNYFDNCFSVRDSWLKGTTNGVNNSAIIVKFVAAIIAAQRWAISNPSQLVTFAESQLPLTAPSEIQFTSTFYPAAFTYTPYGSYNLIGDQNLTGKFQQTSTFYIDAGVITSPVSNSSVQPYGVVNKWFEYQALQSLGPYSYPMQSWVTPSFESTIQAAVPSWMGGIGTSTATSSG